MTIDERTWHNGYHQVHCREDRCCFGCSCPCHHGVKIRPSFSFRVKWAWWTVKHALRLT